VFQSLPDSVEIRFAFRGSHRRRLKLAQKPASNTSVAAHVSHALQVFICRLVFMCSPRLADTDVIKRA